MRSFSIISILIALAAVGILMQKSLEKSRSDLLPKPVVISTPAQVENCDDYSEDSANCNSNVVDEEQAEMEEQNREGYAVMMKSYNKKLEKYNNKINGKQ